MGTLFTCRAVLLCALCAGAAQAQDIGRLFMTPAQRDALESLRHGGKAPAAGGAAAGAAPVAPLRRARAAEQDDQVLVVNGIVTRSGPGRSTVWIDSVPYSENGRTSGGVALAGGRSSASVALTLRSGRQVKVRPGQRVDTLSGRIVDSYQDLPAPAARKTDPQALPE